jgi:4-hydroxy-tetrahydrodipicolinate synthase
MGTTGEFASFSVAERKRALESTIKHRGSLGVMAQIATPSLPETLDLAEHAAKSGADSVLVLPPFYYKNRTADGIAAFFEPVLKASKLPVLLYNIPQYSGAAITPELLRKLAHYDNLYGIKDSFSNAEAMTALLREFPRLRIMTGLHQNIAANLKNNGAGGLTGNGSLFLKATAAIFEAHKSGMDILEPQRKLDSIATLLTGYDGVPAMKFLLSTMGLRESAVRPPFTPLATSARQELLAKFGRA